MVAIFNSLAIKTKPTPKLPSKALFSSCLKPFGTAKWTFTSAILFALLMGAGMLALADADPKATAKNRASTAFTAAKARYDASPTNSEAAWQLGRATFDWADFATNGTEREGIADVGIAACRKVVATDPKLAAGHYYLAMDLGQLAQTKTLGALKIVTEMEAEFHQALTLDPMFDLAGPDRNLGLLYRDAPGWPASIGNRAKAHEHLQQSCKLAPDYPENWLNLVEADFAWSEKNAAASDFSKLTAIWTAAHDKFAGDDWAYTWVDWNTRMDAVKKKISKLKLAEPPHKFNN